MRYEATINGKPTVIHASAEYDGFGYTPTIDTREVHSPTYRLRLLAVGGGMEKKNAVDVSSRFLESLGFTKCPQPRDKE